MAYCLAAVKPAALVIGHPLRYEILSVPVDVQTFEEALTTLHTWLVEGKRSYVSTCTVYSMMIAQKDPAALSALQHATMVTTDGMPLVWLQKRAGFKQAERVYGPDLFLELCARTEKQHFKHFFLGGNPGVAEQLQTNLLAKFPDMVIAGHEAPQVSNNTGTMAVDAALAERLNASGADIIWVGLGAPKQDVWMEIYRPVLNATLLVGVGAAFDFIAGTKQQAPQWMQQNGLEWVFRLVNEPRRLWKRYLVYNTLFVYAILQWRIGKIFKQHSAHR